MNFHKKYKGKDILIIGGGTSTLDVKWENIITPETFVWTCNDFYLNERVMKQTIDLYQLAYTTPLTGNDKLIEKLRYDRPFTYYEFDHYRTKYRSDGFKQFEEAIGYPIPGMNIDMGEIFHSPAQKSGAVFRLILLASITNARNIYFVGFDGFNKGFTNAHAFTGHRGLKETDTRRSWDGNTPLSYKNVFSEAYKYLASLPCKDVLQNLGEGQDYNLGTDISSQYFPLREDIKKKIQ